MKIYWKIVQRIRRFIKVRSTELSNIIRERIDFFIQKIRKYYATDKVAEAAGSFENETSDLENRPVSGAATWISRAIVALVIIALLWSYFGQVDKVVVGQGKLVTTVPLAVVQPLETSILSELAVSPGDSVQKGAVLARLEPTFQQSDMLRNQEQENALAAYVKRIGREVGQPADLPDSLGGGYEKLQDQISEARMAEYQAKVSGYRSVVLDNQQQLKSLANSLPIIAKQFDVARKLSEINELLAASGAGTQVAAYEAEERLAAVKRQYQEQLDRQKEIAARLDKAKRDLEAFERSWRRELLDGLATGYKDFRETVHAGEKLRLRSDLVVMKAPVSGTVFSIAKRSVGSVLREAEEFITIVPSDSDLEAEVMISPEDVGRIRVGDKVVMKFDAYPYTRYGTLDGRVRWISADAKVVNEETQRNMFVSRIQLLETSLAGKNTLKPGFTLSADLIVGRQRVVSYLLDPLEMTWRESMREP